MKNIDVSIIIVTYNTYSITNDCIKSIYEKTEGISFEIIVVDNASKDGSKELFENDFRISYVYLNENIGFGRANNVALKKAKGRNILFLNSDTLLINNAIKILSDFLDQSCKAGAVGGNLYSDNGTALHSYRRLTPMFFEINLMFATIPSKLLFGKNEEHNHTQYPIIVNTIVGADLMIKKSVLDKVGGFDERFFMYCEETELCHRVRKTGYKLFSIPSAQIVHLEGASFSEERFFERIKMNRKSLNLYCSLHYGAFYATIVEKLWRVTIYSRIIVYSILCCSNKKKFWKTIEKKCKI